MMAVTVVSLALSGCGSAARSQMERVNDRQKVALVDDRYRTTYEVFVYSFADGDGDGVGDLKGLTSRLDYINDADPKTRTDLEMNEIWLSPICPSTTYHKYDVTDYENIDPEYGTLEDFDAFLAACQERGIHVILDMVMNHTSSQHPWFLQAAEYLKGLPEGTEPDAAACPYVSYYHFSREAQDGYAPLSGSDWYYEARFWEEMPDLNLTNPQVQEEFRNIAAFWLDRGVSGFRMDAVTSYETGDTAASTADLAVFASNVKTLNPDAYIVCEGWSNSKDYAQYYASGVDSMFDFDYSGTEGLISGFARGTRKAADYPKSQVEHDQLYASYNPSYINAPFYTNHDMGRSAGYYTGEGKDAKVKLAGALNLLMGGNAFVYYGEEIGMKGSGKDENKRAPMQWVRVAEDQGGGKTASGNPDSGMCKGPVGMDDIEMPYGSVEEQQQDPWSIWNYYREAVRLRNLFPVIARGEITCIEELSGKEVCVYVKSGNRAASDSAATGMELQPVMIAINMSGETQIVDLAPGNQPMRKLSGVLTTSEEEVVVKDDTLTLPAYGIAILTE